MKTKIVSKYEFLSIHIYQWPSSRDESDYKRSTLPRTWNVLSAQLSNYLIFLQQKCICLTKILSSSRIYLSIVVSLLFLGKTLSFRQFAIWFYGFLVGMGNIITNNNRNGSTTSTVMFFLWLFHLAEMSEEERERESECSLIWNDITPCNKFLYRNENDHGHMETGFRIGGWTKTYSRDVFSSVFHAPVTFWQCKHSPH